MNCYCYPAALLEGDVFTFLARCVHRCSLPGEGLHQSQGPWVPLLPCGQAPTPGAWYKYFSGLCNPCRGGHPKKRELQVKFPIVIRMPTHLRRSAQSNKTQSNCSTAQLSPICWKTVEKSTHLLGPQSFNYQKERISLNKLYLLSPQCSGILQLLILYRRAPILSHLGISRYSSAWRRPYFWIVGAVEARNSMMGSRSEVSEQFMSIYRESGIPSSSPAHCINQIIFLFEKSVNSVSISGAWVTRSSLTAC